MEAKQKAIQEAYGENWEIVKDCVDDYGWINNDIYKFTFGQLKNLDSEYKDDVFFRPKSLQGIENNNGWIKIESEADLPKELTDCFIRTIYPKAIERLVVIGNHVLTGELVIYDRANDNHYEVKEVTHYQPIQKPKPPIY